MNRILLVALILLGLGWQKGQAQSLKAWLKAASDAYERKDYYSAYNYYGVALEFDSSQLVAWDRYATSAMQFGAYSKADSAFAELAARDTEKKYPLATFWRAESKLYLGQYEAAANLYEAFLTANPELEGPVARRAESALEKCAYALNWEANPGRDTIRHGGTIINSTYSDFGAAAIGDTLYFSSLRFVNPKDTLNPPRPLIKLLRYIKGDTKAEVLSNAINIQGKHVGHSAFNADFSRLYYTECEYLNATDIRCTLMIRDRGPNGTWVNPRPASVNKDGYTTTQPNIGFDSTRMEEVLYFVSDRPGPNGEENFDIWYSSFLAKDSLSEPQNLELNTSLNDVTPFFHTATQTLYFSSDGYPGFGGYDVFQVKPTDLGWTEPENLNFPINSSYNDLYYASFLNGSNIYFSSNRPDSLALFWDEQHDACCNDIYLMDKEVKIRLLALTFSSYDSTALAGTSVALYRIGPGGEEILVDSLTNLSGNDFVFGLTPNTKYKIKATRDGYTSDSSTVDLTDVRLHNTLTIQRELYLTPPEPPADPIILDVLTFERSEEFPLNGVRVRLFEITPEGEEILVETEEDPTGNSYTFNVLPGKQYVIKGMKDGFTTAREYLDLTQPELIPGNRLERKLILFPPDQLVKLITPTFEVNRDQPLSGTAVELYELTPLGPRLITRVENPNGNKFEFDVLPGKKYYVKGMRDNYIIGENQIDLTPKGLQLQPEYERDLFLIPPGGVQLDVLTFQKDNTMPLSGVEVTLYELTPDGPVLVATIENPERNDFTFPVVEGKKYRLVGTKNGYSVATDEFDLSQPGLIVNGRVSRELILMPPPKPLSLKPLTFENDLQTPLNGVTVELYEITPEGPRYLVEAINPRGNDFEFPVVPGKIYMVKGKKAGYIGASQTIDLSRPDQITPALLAPNLILKRDETQAPLQLDVLTFEVNENQPLQGVTVELYEITPDGPVLITRIENPTGNDFHFPVVPGKQYLIKGMRDGYTTDQTTLDLTNPDLITDSRIERRLILNPSLDPISLRVLTFHTENTRPLEGVTVELYEFTPQGLQLVATKRNPTGNDFTFPVLPSKRYWVKGSKPGFLSDRDTIDFSLIRLQPGATLERELILTPRPPVQLDVFTYHRNPSNPLEQVTVSLYEITPDGPKLIQTVTNPDSNDFHFPLIRGKQYLIKGQREGYSDAEETVDLTDPALMEMSRIERQLILFRELDEEPRLEIRTFEGDTLTPLPGVKLELVRLIDGRPQPPEIQRNDFGNDFLYPLQLGVPYIISASKPGFDTFRDTTIFRLPDVNPNTGLVSLALIMNRISFDDFLPLALYYDNDRPDPRTLSRTTRKAYPEVYQPYYDKKDQFIEEFTRFMNEEEKFLTSERFEDFFEREVGNGFRDLLDFSEKLYQYLKQGNSIEIEILGYCSPRGNTNYNDYLSERRIDCVINHFESFRRGVLLPFIRSKKLSIKTSPKGERTASTDVSDSFDDDRNSIYSVLASVERRVEIIEVKTTISNNHNPVNK